MTAATDLKVTVATARSTLERGAYAEAVELADVILAGDAKCKEALLIKATAYTELKLWDKARTVIRKSRKEIFPAPSASLSTSSH